MGVVFLVSHLCAWKVTSLPFKTVWGLCEKLSVKKPLRKSGDMRKKMDKGTGLELTGICVLHMVRSICCLIIFYMHCFQRFKKHFQFFIAVWLGLGRDHICVRPILNINSHDHNKIKKKSV